MRTLLALCTLIAPSLPFVATADDPGPQALVVIVNPDCGVDSLTASDAINIFMGRYRKLTSGIVAFPIDVVGHSSEREQFYGDLVRKDLAEIDAYWSRLVFSGQTSPPLQVPDGRTAVQLVAGNRAAIAYVDAADADARVKVVLRLERQ